MRFTLLLFVFFCTVSRAQTDFHFNNYTINEGLSQSVVTCIEQDVNGLLWIGTQDGLNHFDGKEFEVFSADETNGLESSYITSSVKNSDGTMWFGTMNGLTSYNPQQENFQSYSPFKNTPFQIESISVDNQGKLYVGSLSSGLRIFDPKTKKFSRFSNFSSTLHINNVLVIPNGVLVSTEEKRIFLFSQNGSTYTEIKLHPERFPEILRIKQMSANSIYFGTDEGVFSWDISAKSVKKEFEILNSVYGKLSVTDFYETSADNWFIATQKNGLFNITPEHNVFQSSEDIFQRTTLLNNEIICLFVDRQNICWVGSQRGLSSFDPLHKGFVGIGPSGNLSLGLPTSNVWSFSEDKNQNYVFVGTDLGVSRYNRITRRFDHFLRAKTKKGVVAEETTVLCLTNITNNKLLVGCADGLFILKISSPFSYSFEKVKFKDLNDNEQFSRTYAIERYKENWYFIATKGGVLLYNIQTGETKSFTHDRLRVKHSISAGICRMIYKDKQDKFWFATSNGGLNELHTENGEMYISPSELNYNIGQHSKDYIYCMYQQSDDVIWIGTFGSGLLRIKKSSKEIRQFKKTNGLPNNVIYSILPDNKKNLWFSTNKGLVKFNPQSLDMTTYGELNGLMSNEMNLGAYMRSGNGQLFFGGISGFNYFDPNEIENTNTSLTVHFTKFKLENDWLSPGDSNEILPRSISYMDEVNLPYTQRNFTLKFTTSDLSNPKLVNYKYILEGSDEREIFLGSSNEIRFNSLSPGNYVLKVFARVGNGEWTLQPAEMRINVAAPFWQKVWFWISFAALLALLIRFFVRRKIDSSRREQVRLEIKIAERTKEIRQQNVKISAQSALLEKEKNKVLEQQRLLKLEKEKTERILLNVIPESTALELKKHGKASARAYKRVSVLFTDFIGFTKIAERMKPSELVSRLDVYFRKFDEIIMSNNLEKIKTIGDAYMCAGGVPVRNNTNPIDACLAGLQIQDYISKLKLDAIANDTEYWELRLGINTGEVTAGVIGRDRLAYDIWGSTVNQAQRMEMMSEPGKVTITGNTFRYIEPYFECAYRGKAQSKSKGLIDMYVVERIKPELSLNGEGLFPNDLFHQIFNLHHYSSINYYKAERHIMKVLQDGLSPNLHYHSIEHTQDVVRAVEFYALREGVTDEGLFLLKSAATYHDAGFVENYEKNEPIGARMAEEILPKYGYSEKHIEDIKKLIYVTQIPHRPKNQLEEIICDADLDYLGRDDFFEISDKLKRELMEHGKIANSRAWDEIQVSFLTNHRYFTKTAIELRKAKKIENLEAVKRRLAEGEYDD